MGCACGKPSAIEDSRESPKDRPPPQPAAAPAIAPAKLTSHSRRDEVVFEKKEGSGPIRVGNGQEIERRPRPRSNSGQLVQLRVVGGVPKVVEGEQVAAGWPAWLAAVAGEAIMGWVPRRADSFEKLDKKLNIAEYQQRLGDSALEGRAPNSTTKPRKCGKSRVSAAK